MNKVSDRLYESFAKVTALETEVESMMGDCMRLPPETPSEIRLAALDKAGYSAEMLRNNTLTLLPIISRCLESADDEQTGKVIEGMLSKTDQYRILSERVIRLCDYAHRTEGYRLDPESLSQSFWEDEPVSGGDEVHVQDGSGKDEDDSSASETAEAFEKTRTSSVQETSSEENPSDADPKEPENDAVAVILNRLDGLQKQIDALSKGAEKKPAPKKKAVRRIIGKGDGQ